MRLDSLLRKILFALLALFAMADASARILLMLPGYEGNASWRRHIALAPLVASGWQDHGVLVPGRPLARCVKGENRFYTVVLDNEAPLMVQLAQLESMLRPLLAVCPNQRLVIAGHSAGGVLGRLLVVRHPEAPVDMLVTIASPHLGTDMAKLARMAGDSPMGWMLDMMGEDSLNRSVGLFRDLEPASRPGRFLFWLNHQPHPPIRYVSVIHPDDNILPFGFGPALVPAFSQDMNHVPALAGRSETLVTGAGHGLVPPEGVLLARLLATLPAEPGSEPAPPSTGTNSMAR